MASRKVDPLERFWSKVEKTESCWVWKGSYCPNGYGCFWVDGKNVSAHRFAYRIVVGRDLGSSMGCHKCNNPKCVRPHPEHVYAGDERQNMEDRKQTGAGYSMCRPPLISGVRHHNAKLNPEVVKTCRDRYSMGERVTDLAREFNVDFATMKSAVKRETWRNVV